MDTLLIPRASTQELYNSALGAALHAPFIWDTDEVLQSDPAAYEKMRNDTVVAHLIQQRKHEVAGLEWFLEPASQHTDDKRLAKVLEGLLKQVGNFPTARFNLAEAILRGSAWAGIRGGFRRCSVADLPSARWWTVTEIVDMDKRRFRQQHVEEPGDPEPRFEWFVKRPYAQKWEEIHREWYVHHTYGDEESSLHFGKGLSKALSYYWWLKTETLKLGVKWLDRWALGLLSAKVGLDPQSRRDPGNSSRVASWLKALKAMREGYALVYDKEDLIEHQESNGVGHQAVVDMLGYFDGSMRVLVLGSSLPTAPDAQGGSYAMAKVQAAKSRSLIRFDRALLEETLTRDVVKLMMRANWATIAKLGLRPTGVPQFKIRDEEQDDPVQRAQVIQTALSFGLKVRLEDIYTQLQLTPPGEDDEVLNGASQPGQTVADALRSFVSGEKTPADGAGAPVNRVAQRLAGGSAGKNGASGGVPKIGAPKNGTNGVEHGLARGRSFTTVMSALTARATDAGGLEGAPGSNGTVRDGDAHLHLTTVQAPPVPQVNNYFTLAPKLPDVKVDARSSVTVPERALTLHVDAPRVVAPISNSVTLVPRPARARELRVTETDAVGSIRAATIQDAEVSP